MSTERLLITGTDESEEIETGTNSGGYEVRAGGGDDTIHGSDGVDEIWGEAGDDRIYGGGSTDAIVGGEGDDEIHGGDGHDGLRGDAGNDRISGDAGHDAVLGGEGDDILDGGEGNDYLDGGDDMDVLHGGDGDDTLVGGGGVDVLHGGAGNDSLDGGTGNDTIYGGEGADTFKIDAQSGNDSIMDFTSGQDVIDLSGIDGISSLSDLSLRDAGDGVEIDLSDYGGGVVWLKDVSLDDLDASDFVFAASEPSVDAAGRSSDDGPGFEIDLQTGTVLSLLGQSTGGANENDELNSHWQNDDTIVDFVASDLQLETLDDGM